MRNFYNIFEKEKENILIKYTCKMGTQIESNLGKVVIGPIF